MAVDEPRPRPGPAARAPALRSISRRSGQGEPRPHVRMTGLVHCCPGHRESSLRSATRTTDPDTQVLDRPGGQTSAVHSHWPPDPAVLRSVTGCPIAGTIRGAMARIAPSRSYPDAAVALHVRKFREMDRRADTRSPASPWTNDC